MKKYRVLIVGAGSIGALKPDKYDSPVTENILTHAHAVMQHSQTDLIAIVDKDKNKALKAAKKWNCIPFSNLHKAFEVCKRFDIVIVATPTNIHFDVLLELLQYSLKLVIAEKPLTDNAVDCKIIVDKYQKAGIPLMVNYLRRFEPMTQNTKVIIKSSIYGKVLGCRILYNRGIKRDGVHSLDLMQYFFGGYIRGQILGKPIIDLSKDDPTYPVFMEFEGCPNVSMLPIDGRKMGCFELDILFERAKISFVNFGLYRRIYTTEPGIYGDYDVLGSCPSQGTKTELNTALIDVIQNAANYFEKKTLLLCTGEDALEVHRMIDRVMEDKL